MQHAGRTGVSTARIVQWTFWEESSNHLWIRPILCFMGNALGACECCLGPRRFDAHTHAVLNLSSTGSDLAIGVRLVVRVETHNMRHFWALHEGVMKFFAFAAFTVLCITLGGCGLAAAPCRVASAGLKIVPVVGHVAAVPTDTCAAVID